MSPTDRGGRGPSGVSGRKALRNSGLEGWADGQAGGTSSSTTSSTPRVGKPGSWWAEQTGQTRSFGSSWYTASHSEHSEVETRHHITSDMRAF